MGIPLVYFRSSSYNAFRRCEHEAFMTYSLGLKAPSGKAADKGTIVHKALEICALSKKAHQDGLDSFEDEILGTVETNNREPDYLDHILETSYKYYSEAFSHHNEKAHAKWRPADLRDCRKWMWDALKFNDGMFDPMNRTIVAAEPNFDFQLEEDWASYDYNYKGESLTGKLALKGTIDQICETDSPDIYEIVDWKGLPIETKLPTPDGWTTMGEVQVGDLVFDQDGKQTRVLGKSKVAEKECFEITFDDTSKVICDCDHLWALMDGSTVAIKDLKIKDKIKVPDPIKTKHVNLPIDPYVLGIWLGDGKHSSGEITITEDYILNKIVSKGYKISQDISSENRSSSYTIYNLISEIKMLGLYKDKYIPQMYLRASYEQRLELLQGLMDSDGNVNPTRKQAVFTNCNKKLSDGVKELLLSLGQRPLQSVVNRNTNFKEDITVYPISFRPINIEPFSLPRKQRQITWTGKGISYRRMVTDIKSVGIMETQCIMVDSNTSTYLCTDNMIPTHNTGARKDWATGEEKGYRKLFTDFQLRLYHLAAKHMYPHVHSFIITIFFIKDGGPFTMHFDDHDIEDTKRMIKEKFLYLKEQELPKMLPDLHPKSAWQCSKMCHFGRNSFVDHKSILPIIEERPFKKTPQGDCMTKCQQVRFALEEYGMDWVIQNMSEPGFKLDKYKDPGAINQ